MAQQQAPKVSGGMFGALGGSGTFKPTMNPQEWGKATYDFSGLQAGANAMQNTPQLNIAKHNPYQFSTSNYGRSSDQEIGNTYNQAYKAGASPLISQANERMRGMSQGFGAGAMGSPAMKKLQMRNSMQTGSDLQGLSNNISAGLADRRLSQDETQRAAMFGANQDRQKSQAQENYQSAGFNASSAQAMSQDAIGRASQLMQYGMQLPQIQMSMNQAGMSPYMDLMNQARTMANSTIPPGSNLQTSGKK